MFLQVSVCPHQGGRVWLLGGVRGCSGGVCMVALGGHAWLLLGGCMVAPGGMHGYFGGGMCGFWWGHVRGFFRGGHA